MSLYKTTDEQKVKLYEIATKMKKEGLEARFIANAVQFAEIYEGAYDFFNDSLVILIFSTFKPLSINSA